MQANEYAYEALFSLSPITTKDSNTRTYNTDDVLQPEVEAFFEALKANSPNKILSSKINLLTYKAHGNVPDHQIKQIQTAMKAILRNRAEPKILTTVLQHITIKS